MVVVLPHRFPVSPNVRADKLERCAAVLQPGMWLTDECIDKQRDIDARVVTLQGLVVALTQEQGGLRSQLAARHREDQ